VIVAKIKAALTVRYCLGAIKETAGFFMVCDLTF
jgi:hypothetical protein